jgi:hypothetical protein
VTDTNERLARQLTEAEEALSRVRAENAEAAEKFREEPSDDKRELLKRGAQSLAEARDRVSAAKAALSVFEKTGSEHGLVAEDGKVFGSIAVSIKPGTSRAEREKAVDAALAEPLGGAAQQLGVVLAAAPGHYTRERPGRDEEGRTVLEVQGRVEGDRLVPAVSRAARLMRN